MKRILNKGNMPKHLQVLATQMGGKLSNVAGTEFYEAKTIAEFEKNASEIGYEIVPTVDTSTDRGFLVGFSVSSPERIATLLDYSSLKIYYVECSAKEIEEWTRKIQQHRRDQEEDMRQRRTTSQESKKRKNPLKITPVTNGGLDD